MRLNIWKNQTEIEKTYEVDTYDIFLGNVEDLFSIFDGVSNITNTEEVFKAIDEYKLEEKFKNSTYSKKCELRQKRANLTDFDRFKVMRLRQKRAALRHAATKGLKKAGDKKEKKPKKK